MDDFAIKVESLNKVFKLPHEKNSSIKSAVVNFGRRDKGYELQKALKDVSFEVKKGEFFGIVGRNGSGKSTLLKLLAGIYAPTAGQVHIRGSLTPFIELGVGFNPELTGRENVFLNGALLGFSRKEMHALYKDIVDFAELERFMDQKLKNYSSGMQVRLAFSIAIRANSEILLLDEVLAVGDSIFQKKCYNYFRQLKKDKRTVVFVSHDTNALLEYCDKGILIESGKIIEIGDIAGVVNDYIDLLTDTEEFLDKKAQSETSKRWGTGQIRVESISIRRAGASVGNSIFTDKDKNIKVGVNYKAKAAAVTPVYGITVTDIGGARIFTANTKWDQIKTKDLKKGQQVKVEWTIPNVFNTGDFIISPAVADEDGSIIYDWVEGMGKFKVRKKISNLSYINADHSLTIKDDNG